MGAGKGKLLNCVTWILTGVDFPTTTYTEDHNELRKKITSIAMEGHRMVLFDNVVGNFGNADLAAALTSTVWKDRILGVSKTTTCPLYCTWFATANNVCLSPDMPRRVCHIRLESPKEHPEERTDFTHKDLKGWVLKERLRLLSAALTILRGYCVAGRPRPEKEVLPWGSFENWFDLVCGAVIWATGKDPGETRTLLREQADVTRDSLAVLLDCWSKMDPKGLGMTTSDVVRRLTPKDTSAEAALTTNYPFWKEMVTAIETLTNKLTARSLGNFLHDHARRVVNGHYIDIVRKTQGYGLWAVLPDKNLRESRESEEG
jgi:hypothetical protein